MVGFFPGRSVNSIENKMRDMTVYSDWRRLKDACGDDWADERTQRLIQAIKGIVGGLEQGMPAELRDKEVLYRLSQRADLRECWGRQRILMVSERGHTNHCAGAGRWMPRLALSSHNMPSISARSLRCGSAACAWTTH